MSACFAIAERATILKVRYLEEEAYLLSHLGIETWAVCVCVCPNRIVSQCKRKT
uniref:Uncharacterized protein n=1 Tax=Anguilla anguilla TaxID=7936 RepID=A0A0E9W8K3_ANGAN